MAIEVSLHGDDVSPLRLDVVTDRFEALVPYLRLADDAGVTVKMTPTSTEESQEARSLCFELEDAETPEGLAAFLLTVVALDHPGGVDSLIQGLVERLNRAVNTARYSGR